MTVDESFNNYHFDSGMLINGDRYLDQTERDKRWNEENWMFRKFNIPTGKS